MLIVSDLFRHAANLRGWLEKHSTRRAALAVHGIDVAEHPSDDEVARLIRKVPMHRGSALYFVYNSSLATTAAPVKQPTGTAIRTMMQLKLGATLAARIAAWGASFDASASAAPGQVELFETTVAATMSTAYANADIQPFSATAPANSGNQPVDVTSTSTSGFATAAVTEGTVANYRGFDLLLYDPAIIPYVQQFPLGREPEWKSGNFLRIRNTLAASVNAYFWVLFEV